MRIAGHGTFSRRILLGAILAAAPARVTTASADEEPVDAPPPPVVAPRQVIEAFVGHLETHEDYAETARRFVIERRPTGEDENLNEYLKGSLAVLSDGYRLGLESLEKDQAPTAAALFEALSEDVDPFLAVAAANLGATAMIELEQFDRCKDMLVRVEELHGPIERYTLEPDHFRFMLGYSQVSDLDYETARATLEGFLKRFPDAPQRLQVTARQILTEISRRMPGQMGDVRDLLRFAWRKLDRGVADEKVIDRQEKAVELLSAMIDEAEQQEQQGSGGGGSGGQGGGQAQGAGQPGGGAAQSNLPGGNSKVGELRRQTARPGEMWGRMPPKEREAILQSLQRRFPGRYRELLEQYYEELAKQPLDR